MSGTLFSEASGREIHPTILSYIQNALEDLPNDQAHNVIRSFLSMVETRSAAARRPSGVDSSIHELLALYNSPTSPALIGVATVEEFQNTFKQALEHYATTISVPSQAASNPVPFLLGFRCFSLRTIETLGIRNPDELDLKIIRDYAVRRDQFFARMSSSSMGMVVFVAKPEDKLLRNRIALVYRPGDEDNPFQLRTINNVNADEGEILAKINRGLRSNPCAPIDLGDGSSVIPLTSDLPEILASLGDPRATLANAKLAFSNMISRMRSRPIDPPAEAASKSYSSGRDAYGSFP